MLATMGSNVARHYDLGETSQQTVDWCQFFLALGVVYGARIPLLLSNKPKAETAQRPATQPAAAFFTPATPPPPGSGPRDPFGLGVAAA